MTPMEQTVTELLHILERDVQYMQTTLTWLAQLREFVIGHEDTALQRLLEQIQSEAAAYRDNESRRRELRHALASTLQSPPEKVTLSRLEGVLSGQLRSQVSQIRGQLQSAARALQSDHAATMLFLSDCARFNRLLLRTVLGGADHETTTYTPRGTNQGGARSTSLVDMQF